MMKLPLWQTTLWMNSCDFIPILLFRRTWPEMGKDVSHQRKEIKAHSQWQLLQSNHDVVINIVVARG